jgi:hypothetical protein
MDAQSWECRSNFDGVIHLDELPLNADARIRYLFDRVDASELDDWDLSRPKTIDSSTFEAGLWPVDAIPVLANPEAGDWLTPLAEDHGLWAHLELLDDGISVVAMSSLGHAEDEGATRVVYDEPVSWLPLPLSGDATHTAAGKTRDGLINGLPTAVEDLWTVKTAGPGPLVLSDWILDNTIQVEVRLQRRTAYGRFSQTTVHHFQECTGEVARVVHAWVQEGQAPHVDPENGAAPGSAGLWRLAPVE